MFAIAFLIFSLAKQTINPIKKGKFVVPKIWSTIKNGFAIFSWAVAAGAKGGLMVPGMAWAITGTVQTVAASM